jgi:hypothetical protein
VAQSEGPEFKPQYHKKKKKAFWAITIAVRIELSREPTDKIVCL